MAAPSKANREKMRELGEGCAAMGHELVDLIESWDDADKEEREGITDEIGTALREIIACGETALALALLVEA